MTGQTSLFPPEPAPDPLLCWLWLSQVLGPASLHAGKVLDAFGGAQEAWEARETEEFRQAAGDTAFKRAAQLDAESFHTLVMQCDALRVRILPFDDPDYPLAFSRIPDMPLVLYCTGDARWLNEPGAVGIVGSRKPTEYGLNAAADIGGELAKNGAIIVSGLADGLDSAGHRAAVKNDCPTIAVMGVPIDRTYPAANAALRQKIEQKGCVISEYPPYSEYIGPTCFLQRNRLIAALSYGCTGGGSTGKKRHYVHRCPRRALRQAGVRGAGQHLLPQLGGHERPAAGRTRPGSGGCSRPAGGAGPAHPAGSTGGCKAACTPERYRAPGAGGHRAKACGYRGAVREHRPAHVRTAGHPDEAGTHRPGVQAAGAAVCAAVKLWNISAGKAHNSCGTII